MNLINISGLKHLIITLYLAGFFIPAIFNSALAAPMIENTRTLEVKLRYKAVDEINISSAFSEEDNRSEAGGSLFKNFRNSRVTNDFIIAGGLLATAGDFGAGLKRMAFAGKSGGAAATIFEESKYENAFKILNGVGCFGAELSAAAFDGENFYFGARGGDLIELNDRAVRRISIISAAGRFGINKLKTRGGALFILTAGGGLYIYVKNRIYKISDRSHGLASNDVNDIDIFEKNNITYLALALSGGSVILKVNSFEANDMERVYSQKSASSFDAVHYEDGSVYFGGASGLERVEIGAVNFEKTHVLKDIFVTSITGAGGGTGSGGTFQGENPAVIFSTYASGIFSLGCRGGVPVKLITQSRLASVKAAEGIKKVEAAGGALYLLSKNALFKYSGSGLQIIEENSRGFSDKITALCEYAGYLFCATFDGGVFVYDRGRALDFGSLCAQKLSGAQTNALARFGNYLLIGSTSGLDVFDHSSRRLIPLKNPLESPRVNALHVSSERAFIGTSAGISVLKADMSVENISLDPNIIDKRVYCIYYDRASDIIYFGTYRGFGEMKYSSRQLKTYFTINSAIADNWVTAIAPYDPDNLLAATYDRAISLFNLRTKKFTPFGAKNTLPSKMVNANALFNYGDFTFAGTYNGGLALIDRGRGGRSRHFNARNALMSNMVTSFAVYKDTIAAGTFSGISFIRQKDLQSAFEF